MRMGDRSPGNPNDADCIRTCELKYLIEALDKALPFLQNRIASLPDDSDDKALLEIEVEGLIEVNAEMKDSYNDPRRMIAGGVVHQLWSFAAVAVELIHVRLRDLGA